MGDEQQKVEYLTTHKVPQLLDFIVTQLLQELPQDPGSFVRGLDIGKEPAGGAAPAPAAAAPAEAPKKKAAGFGAEEPAADTGKKKAAGFAAEGGGGDGPKKKAGVAVVDAASPKGKSLDGPKKGPSKADVANVKSFRREFFESFHNEDWNTVSNVRGVHLGCIALALSYLIRGKKSLPPMQRVTLEDVFFHARLPLFYLGNSGITLAELYDIAVKYIKNDPRFKESVQATLVHFDSKMDEDDPGVEAGPSIALADFRKSMDRDSRDDRHIRVFNYDPFVAEQASLALDGEDEDEEEEDEMTEEERAERNRKREEAMKGRAKRKNRGAYGVFAEYNAFKHSVKLADVYTDNEIKMKPKEFLVNALYKSCNAMDGFNNRPRGYIEFRGDAENFEAVEADDDELDNNWKCPLAVDDKLLEAYPSGSTGTCLVDVAATLSPHVIAVAWGLHLIQGAAANSGIDIGDLIKVNKLPVHVLINDTMSLEQVHAYAQAYLDGKKADDGKKWAQLYKATAYPISTPEGVEDAAPSMSVMDLEQYLGAMMKVNPDPKEPNTIMLLNFDVCLVHSVMGLDKGSVRSHWAVFVSYDEREQMIRMADVMPKKFCKYWNVPLTRLHNALIGKGFLLFHRLVAGQPPALDVRRGSMARSGSAKVRTEKVESKARAAPGGDVIKSFEFPPQVYCPAIIALAFSRMDHYTLFEDVIGVCGIDVNFLLSDHISLHDITRIARYTAKEKNIPITVTPQVMDNGRNKQAHVTLQQFAAVIDAQVARLHKDPKSCQLIFNYAAEQVHPAQLYHSSNGGDYAVALDFDKDRQLVTCCDLNPKKFYRTWSVPITTLYEACRDPDYASKRPRGYILLEAKEPAAYAGERTFDIRRVVNRHPLKPPMSPQIAGLAYAVSELPDMASASAEDIFYTAYDKMGSTMPELFLLNTLKARITLNDMVDMGNAYLHAHGQNHPVAGKPINEATGGMPISTFEQEIKAGAAGPVIVLAVYSSPVAHDTAGTVGCALVKAYNAGTQMVLLSDVNTTKYGMEWECSLSLLHDACKGDGNQRGLVRFGGK